MNRAFRRRAERATSGQPMTLAEMDRKLADLDGKLVEMEAATEQLRAAIAQLRSLRDTMAAVLKIGAPE